MSLRYILKFTLEEHFILEKQNNFLVRKYHMHTEYLLKYLKI